MATTSEFRNGLCIEFNGDLFKIVEFQHVKPGKGPAFVRTKLKNLKTGKVIHSLPALLLMLPGLNAVHTSFFTKTKMVTIS
jgi:hypothetical protein